MWRVLLVLGGDLAQPAVKAQRRWDLPMRILVALVLGLMSALSFADTSRARTLFQQGEIQFRLLHFDQALSLFERAYEESSDPAFLYNIAQCQRQLGRYELAIKSYRSYLEQAPDAPSRAEVLAVIAQMEEAARNSRAAEKEGAAERNRSTATTDGGAPALASRPHERRRWRTVTGAVLASVGEQGERGRERANRVHRALHDRRRRRDQRCSHDCLRSQSSSPRRSHALNRLMPSLLFLVGCYSPTIGNGQLRCDTNGGRCPKGFECDSGTCWRRGQFNPAPDMSTTSTDMRSGAVLFPSCAMLAASCGNGVGIDCCNSPVVTGGTFLRSYDVGTDNAHSDQTHPAMVSDFRLDKYEVTVGRFRAFVSAHLGTQTNPPLAAAGARTLNGTASQGGWDSSWDSNLPATTQDLVAAVKCDSTFQTWTDTPGSNENRPMTCITWFEAFGFCTWDGGFLPTEAEWNYAAAGGNEQRAYPWSNPASSLSIDCSYANFYLNSPSGTYCVNGTKGGTNDVGSESAKGDGMYGQSDLAGNVWEWSLDWYVSPYAAPSCVDCANLVAASDRVTRGGSANNLGAALRPAVRDFHSPPTTRYPNIGVRCARPK
jgi:formylglycine-generating enzyme required for sulfatase activity